MPYSPSSIKSLTGRGCRIIVFVTAQIPAVTSSPDRRKAAVTSWYIAVAQERAHTTKGGVSERSANRGARGSDRGYVTWVKLNGLYDMGVTIQLRENGDCGGR